MKHLTLGAALATLVGSALAADVGVSVTIGQPGFYGRIDLNNAPQPQVIYAQPMIILQAPVGYERRPIYLRVPPGHEKHWDKNCYKYNACNQPVYFVQDNWYRNEYAPAYLAVRGDDDRGHGKGKGKNKEKKDKGRGKD